MHKFLMLGVCGLALSLAGADSAKADHCVGGGFGRVGGVYYNNGIGGYYGGFNRGYTVPTYRSVYSYNPYYFNRVGGLGSFRRGFSIGIGSYRGGRTGFVGRGRGFAGFNRGGYRGFGRRW